eukprot:gene44255-55017_t
MIARLQQTIVAILVVCLMLWLAWAWPRSPVLAVGCATVLVLGHAFFLAIEFLILRHVNRADAAPQASAAQMLHAWWREIWVALQVFCWRQPFRSNAVPDHLAPGALAKGRCGVVLIHGFMCNRGFWTPWLERLRGSGHPFVAVNLEPVFGSIDDYAHTIEQAVVQLTAASGRPPVLVCHSMGGLVASRFVSLKIRPVDALVLSSPALDAGLGAVQKLLLATLPRIAPNLRVGNGLDAQYLSHDSAVVAAYLADPLCHDRISARLARFIADGGPATVARAAHWSVPT